MLLKPFHLYDLSGESVREAMQFYKIPPEKTIIVYDDISLEPGKLRIRKKGSDGGHNGMKNIIYLMGKDTFPRIKMGRWRKTESPVGIWQTGCCPSSPKKKEKPWEAAADNACEALHLRVQGKEQEAMNKYNS